MLEVNDVCLNFNGLDALSHVSLQIEEGKVTALIGPNGAGKTTMFNCIAGVYKPDKGSIVCDGKDVTGLKPYQICENGIARTYQVIKLFKTMSVLDNVLVGMHSVNRMNMIKDVFHFKSSVDKENQAKEEARQLLKIVGLQNYESFPAGSLSYGQQRLLEIARGLASNPKYLLLDEPAAGMNTTEKRELNYKIKEIIKLGTTVLIVEHDMSLVMNIADKIYVINSGKFLALGTPEEIAHNKEVIEAYLGRGDN